MWWSIDVTVCLPKLYHTEAVFISVAEINLFSEYLLKYHGLVSRVPKTFVITNKSIFQIYADPDVASEIQASMIRCVHYVMGCRWIDKMHNLQVTKNCHQVARCGKIFIDFSQERC